MILTVIGTRPEIIKLSSLLPLLDDNFNHILVHTGQHYSYKLDRIFLKELELRRPDHALEVGSKTPVKQVINIMAKLEPIVRRYGPTAIVVQGDTNSTLGGALTAAKLHIPLIHIEAGCRSFNDAMPEEKNRILTDHCSSLLFAADEVAYSNLLKEGINRKKIHRVGSTVFDACYRNRNLANQSPILNKLNLKNKEFVLVTLHRSENTDDIKTLRQILRGLNKVAKKIRLVFPMHPRTRKALRLNNIKVGQEIQVIEPQGYLDFIKLLDNSLFVITDSGGVQEEAVALNKRALITRTETEWSQYLKAGRNMLAGTTANSIDTKASELLSKRNLLKEGPKAKTVHYKGASKRIVKILKNKLPCLPNPM